MPLLLKRNLVAEAWSLAQAGRLQAPSTLAFLGTHGGICSPEPTALPCPAVCLMRTMAEACTAFLSPYLTLHLP